MAGNQEVLRKKQLQIATLEEMKRALRIAQTSSRSSSSSLIDCHKKCFGVMGEIITSIPEKHRPSLDSLPHVFDSIAAGQLTPEKNRLYLDLIRWFQSYLIKEKRTDDIRRNLSRFERRAATIEGALPDTAGQKVHDNGFVDDEHVDEGEDTDDEDIDGNEEAIAELHEKRKELEKKRSELLYAQAKEGEKAAEQKQVMQKIGRYSLVIFRLGKLIGGNPRVASRLLKDVNAVEDFLRSQPALNLEFELAAIIDTVGNRFTGRDFLTVGQLHNFLISQRNVEIQKMEGLMDAGIKEEYNENKEALAKVNRDIAALEPQVPAANLAISSSDFEKVLALLNRPEKIHKFLPGTTFIPKNKQDISQGGTLMPNAGTDYKAVFTSDTCIITGSKAHTNGLTAVLAVFKEAGVKAVDIDFPGTGEKADIDKMLGIIKIALDKKIAPIFKNGPTHIPPSETLNFILKQDPKDNKAKETAEKYVTAVLNSGDPALHQQLITDLPVDGAEKVRLRGLPKDNVEALSKAIVAAATLTPGEAAPAAKKAAQKEGSSINPTGDGMGLGGRSADDILRKFDEEDQKKKNSAPAATNGVQRRGLGKGSGGAG